MKKLGPWGAGTERRVVTVNELEERIWQDLERTCLDAMMTWATMIIVMIMMIGLHMLLMEPSALKLERVAATAINGVVIIQPIRRPETPLFFRAHFYAEEMVVGILCSFVTQVSRRSI